MKNRLFAVYVTAAMLEIASTMYIASVGAHSFQMIGWAFVGAWLGFAFTSSMIESENLRERFAITAALSCGYATGSAFFYFST